MSLIAVPITNGGTETIQATAVITVTGTAFAQEILNQGLQLSHTVGSGLPVDLNGGLVGLSSGTAQIGSVVLSSGTNNIGYVQVSGLVVTESLPFAYKDQSSLLSNSQISTGSILAVSGGIAIKVLTLWNISSGGTIWLDPSGTSAIVQSGIPLWPGGGSYTFSPPPTTDILAISSSGTLIMTAAGA